MANTILIRNSQDLADGPTELQTATMQVGELAVNTSSGLLYMGADPEGDASTSAGGAVASIDNYFAQPMFGVSDTDTVHGSSLTDAVAISGVSAKPVYKLQNTNADATGPTLQLDATLDNNEAANDVLGNIDFTGNDADNNATTYGRIKGTIGAATAGSESGKIIMGVATTTSGAYADILTIEGGAAAASSTVTIAGNLDVNGTTTTIDSTNLSITDKLVEVARGSADSAAADGAGLTVAGASATITYTNSGTKWNMNKPLSVTGALTSSAAITDGAASSFTTGTTIGNVTIANGSITDSGGALDFGDETLTTSGAVDFGGATLDSVTSTGDFTTTGQATDWDLIDNNASALSFDSTGKAGILNIVTTNSGEKVEMSGGLDVTGTLTAGTFSPSSLAVGGGYGDTGATISAAGVGQFNGALTTDGAMTADSIVCTEGATFGGGYGATGVTISTAGVIQANGALQVANNGNFDGTLTANTSLTLDTTTITTAEIGVLDGVTVGTPAASKVITYDANSFVADDLNLKTADGAILSLNTSETTVVDGDVLGAINFTAPNEASGTDSVLLAGAIECVAEGTFGTTSNASEMVFKLGSSEAATSKMTLSSAGVLAATTFSGSGASLTSLPAGQLSGTVDGGTF